MKKQKELLEQKHEVEINKLKEQIDNLTQLYDHDKDTLARQFDNKIKEMEKKYLELAEKLGF